MAKISDEMIQEINALAHKSKTVGLTEEEKKRQQELRQEYLRILEVDLSNNFKVLKLLMKRAMMSLHEN